MLVSVDYYSLAGWSLQTCFKSYFVTMENAVDSQLSIIFFPWKEGVKRFEIVQWKHRIMWLPLCSKPATSSPPELSLWKTEDRRCLIHAQHWMYMLVFILLKVYMWIPSCMIGFLKDVRYNLCSFPDGNMNMDTYF